VRLLNALLAADRLFCVSKMSDCRTRHLLALERKIREVFDSSRVKKRTGFLTRRSQDACAGSHGRTRSLMMGQGRFRAVDSNVKKSTRRNRNATADHVAHGWQRYPGRPEASIVGPRSGIACHPPRLLV
jgi:hypothetical protein